MLHIT